MKSLKCIALASNILFCLHVVACGPGPIYTPSNYQLFRVASLDNQPNIEFNSHASENVIAWQNLCDTSVHTNDVYGVVYKMPYNDLQRIVEQKKYAGTNTFISWIENNDKMHYLEMLLLAKQCENARSEQNDPWYFPKKQDPVMEALHAIETKAAQEVAKQNELSDRYALQQMRAMFAQQKWQECLALWNEYASNLPEQNVMRKMMMDYVYGAASHISHAEQAQIILQEHGSKWMASYLLEPNNYCGVSSMEKAYETFPDCPQLILCLQRELGEDGLDWRSHDTAHFQSILTLSERIIRERKVSDLAPWYYSASFAEDWLGNKTQALLYCNKAKACKTTPFIAESIRLWSIYVNYQQVLPSDGQLLNDLQWLAKMQIRDTKERRKNEGDFYDRWYVYSSWKMDYWHDAMRRIVHTVLVPRYMKQGNIIRALELTNYGANWYFRKDSICSNYWHSDCFFTMLYQQSGQVAEHYVAHTLSPKTALDKWLSSGGNTMPDYLWDAVGTMYLREAKYAKAVSAFEKVSPSFQQVLLDEFGKTSLFSDPFAPQWSIYLIRRPDCKLAFAREMRELEKEMKISPNINRRANAQIRYALGLRNSFLKCRALTQYVLLEEDKHLQNRKEKLLRSERLITSALEMFDNEEDAAQANLLLLNYATVVKQYPNTQTAQYVRYECDNYYDYHCEHFGSMICPTKGWESNWWRKEYLLEDEYSKNHAKFQNDKFRTAYLILNTGFCR